MTYYTVEGTQRERYAAALSYFAEFHAGKQKAAGVVTAGGSSYMIGLSLNDDGCVTEATLFDSHGHFSLAWHTGAVLKTWKTENPLADLAAYLTRLTSPQFQITPVEIALSNGSDQEGL
jgi:hypothetical protein